VPVPSIGLDPLGTCQYRTVHLQGQLRVRLFTYPVRLVYILLLFSLLSQLFWIHHDQLGHLL
jgi:hypothetical protein